MLFGSFLQPLACSGLPRIWPVSVAAAAVVVRCCGLVVLFCVVLLLFICCCAFHWSQLPLLLLLLLPAPNPELLCVPSGVCTEWYSLQQQLVRAAAAAATAGAVAAIPCHVCVDCDMRASAVTRAAGAAGIAAASPVAACCCCCCNSSKKLPLQHRLRCVPTDAPDAVFPQKTPGPRPLDFRSESLPLAGLVGWGQRKKFTEEEKVELVSIFNCLPGRTEGSQVQKARETLRRMQALGDADMQEAADDAADSSAGAAAAAAGGEAEGGMVAEDAAAEMLADMRRQQIPTVKDSLKQHAARRPQGRFRSKRK